MGEDRCVIVTIVERNIFIADASLHVGERFCVRCVNDLRFSLHYIEETAESGESLLHHLNEFHEDLDRTDKYTDIQGIHGEIPHVHKSVSDEVSSEYKGYQIHHSLEEQVPSHEISHTAIIVPFGNKESMVAFPEFFTFNIFVCKGLDDADACQCILQA